MPEFAGLTADQMKETDLAAFEEYGITLAQLMENAGKAVANACRIPLRGVKGKNILVLAGKGKNGGDAIVAARFLKGWGANVMIILAEEISDKLVFRQLETTKKTGADSMAFNMKNIDIARDNIRLSNLIIDGLIGCGLKGDPRPPVSTLIDFANESGAPIVSVDVPSGMDATTGEAHDPCIRAAVTVTLAFPKAGLLKKESLPYVGDLYVADIGIPPKVYKRFGLGETDLFAESDLVKVC